MSAPLSVEGGRGKSFQQQQLQDKTANGQLKSSATRDATSVLARIAARFDASHNFAFADSCVMLCYVGSLSHGTTIPRDDADGIDDVDLMAVVLPPAQYVVGLDEFDVWCSQWEELDVVVYSFHKFVRLLIKQNPNVLGTLWLRNEDYLVRRTPWRQLEDSRHLFATRAAHGSFAGYANGQLQKMTSYTPATHAELTANEAVLERAGWTLQDVMDKRSVGMPRNGVPQDEANRAADRVRYLRAKYHAAYMGEKRRGLVLKHGYDTKNAAHLIRLLRMCVEFLATGCMAVFRTHDADELKAIKRGEWTVEDVQALALRLFDEARIARDASPLPYAPDVSAISRLVTSIALDSFAPLAGPTP